MTDPLARQSERAGPGILIADDNFLNLQVLRGLLELRGYRVSAVESGGAVIEALEQERFALLIIDCLMPGLDGFETTRIIRTAPGGRLDPEIPILAITALAGEGDQEACLLAGMDAYISKPIIAQQLFETVQRLLEDRPGRAAENRRHPPVGAPGDAGAVQQTALSLNREALLQDVERWQDELRDARARNAREQLRLLAHTIRGTAELLERAALAESARTLEHAASDAPAAAIDQHVDALIADLEDTHARLCRDG